MASEIALSEPKAIETRFSPASLEAAIPGWVSLRELDASFPHGYPLPIPASAGPALREAAALHEAAMAPSTAAERHAILMGLRSATILLAEHADEAEASLALLRSHLADVPLDILQAACRAYCNVPGRRFFPRSAGELRTFTAPPMYARQARAFRLRKLAEAADKADARRAELAADPLTPADVEAILAKHGLSGASAERIRPGAENQTDSSA